MDKYVDGIYLGRLIDVLIDKWIYSISIHLSFYLNIYNLPTYNIGFPRFEIQKKNNKKDNKVCGYFLAVKLNSSCP